MIVPKLDPVSRSREYDQYSFPLRAEVVRGWLFDGKSHRELDQVVLGLDPVSSKGYQAMGILHFLGLKKDFRGLFSGLSSDAAIAILESDPQDFERVLEHLVQIVRGPAEHLTVLQAEESQAIVKSRGDTPENRQKRIAAASTTPERIRVYSYTYRRNADIVVEALSRAAGVCERCASPAPFVRASDGSPFLEVHHLQPLALGGKDSLENVLALCPNCHREVHFGKN